MVLGIDYGRAHVGLAVGDTTTRLALPLASITVRSRDETVAALRQAIRERGVERLVVGLPVRWPDDRSKRGLVGEVEAFARVLRQELALPVECVNERRTSLGAGELRRQGSETDEHALAAMLILQTYLDALDFPTPQ